MLSKLQDYEEAIKCVANMTRHWIELEAHNAKQKHQEKIMSVKYLSHHWEEKLKFVYFELHVEYQIKKLKKKNCLHFV